MQHADPDILLAAGKVLPYHKGGDCQDDQQNKNTEYIVALQRLVSLIWGLQSRAANPDTMLIIDTIPALRNNSEAKSVLRCRKARVALSRACCLAQNVSNVGCNKRSTLHRMRI